MSVLTGKCDLYDDIEIALSHREDTTIDELLKTMEFNIDGEDVEINTYKDLVPYLPCVPGMSIGGSGHEKFWLSSESYVDQEDRERLMWRYRDALKVYKRLKRKKEDITADAIYNGMYHLSDPGIDKQVAEQTCRYGEYAVLNNIHTHMTMISKMQHYHMMREAGYTEEEAINWVYMHKKTWGTENVD